jgi:segregation and condensation protein A
MEEWEEEKNLETMEIETAAVEPAMDLTTMAAATMAADKAQAEKEKAAEKAEKDKAATDRKTAASDFPFDVTVGKVYEGPMDLLLDLVRRQDIDIYDIPISKITKQFLMYVEHLQASDVDTAGEFIYMAALLIQIKSRMLLPRQSEEAGAENEDDPRRELVERLLEHEKFKSAAQMLLQKQQIEEATWTKADSDEFKEDEGTEPDIAVDTVDLVRVFREILERARNRPIFSIEEESATVGQSIGFLRRRLALEDKPIGLHRLLEGTQSQRGMVCRFLALLELVRLQAILLRQERGFGEIYIKKSVEFENVLGGDSKQVRDDWK